MGVGVVQVRELVGAFGELKGFNLVKDANTNLSKVPPTSPPTHTPTPSPLVRVSYLMTTWCGVVMVAGLRLLRVPRPVRDRPSLRGE